jgi:hypothetical protein
MNVPSEGIICIGGLVVVGVVFALIYQTDRRMKREGTTFKQPPSSKSRTYALLLGVFLSSFFLLVLIAGLRLYSLLIIALALIGYGLGMPYLLALYQGRRKIVGIESLMKDELDLCLQADAKFVTFEYCVSVLVLTHTGQSDIYFIRPSESALSRGLVYSLISLFFGWLGFPHGPARTIQSIATNLRGGIDVTKQVVALYHQLGKPSDLSKLTFRELSPYTVHM